ncbi:flagellar hook-length control protein FliK [Desulfosporosinus meridiei]|uniref:Flagellar hook-length control protein n=1 Tax=Desulfosporosinus meridiei (strain ATCC BAA-275 / DSM 13257 / KCTC 12902 / NCIMB 13706 / S10) TaxID=768704 RepID=J7J019_DESMD|nr:flagellar hook-length control protein FliK [Desulfosporosinus meridiei]AFQ45729.1 flagellar hook-length control protein [Desulfosporosinus meridiei DSM 13257]
MSNINVLSDSFKGRIKVENPSEGKVSSQSSANAAALFASFLGDLIQPNSDPKGQNSKEGQDSEKAQGGGDPIQSLEESNGTGMLGYGNFAWLFQSLPMFQSDLPAGKEANSGEITSQGIVNSSLAEADLMNLISLNSDESIVLKRMSAQYAQGGNLGNAELDKYRQVINDLLAALSGTITDVTPQESASEVQTTRNNEIQELAKLIQGWTTALEKDGELTNSLVNSTVPKSAKAENLNLEIAKLLQGLIMSDEITQESDNVNTSNSQNNVGRNNINQLLESFADSSGDNNGTELNAKTATLLATLFPLLMDRVRGEKVPKNSNEGQLSNLMGLAENHEGTLLTRKDGTFSTNTQQRSEGTSFLKRGLLQNFNSLSEEINKANRSKTDVSGIQDDQTQSSSLGVGSPTNIVSFTSSDVKTAGLPLWEQISGVVREQVMSNQHTLKELDIQLHPEELGKVRILLRWEGGQVHLQVHANEAATGQLLQNQLSDLRHNLVNQGVNCGSLEMGHNGERQQQQQGDEARRTFHQNEPLSEDEKQDAVFNNSVGDNRINVTA